MKAAALSLTFATALALGGCGKEAADPNAQAGGEILPRSVSDDMPPYDTVRSQPPLANPDAGLPAASGRPAPDASAAPAEAEAATAEEPGPVVEGGE